MTNSATTEILKTIDPLSEAAQKVIAKLECDKQWIHACKLINGVRSRNEPESTEYYHELIGFIEKKYGSRWVNIVAQRFDEINLSEEKRQAKHQELNISLDN